MTIYQPFCAISEIEDDLNLLGSERESSLYEKIEAASSFLEKEIGWALPVLDTYKFNGRGECKLILPPILSVVSVVNNGITLSAADYVLSSGNDDRPHYANGPYSELHIPYGSSISYWINRVNGVEVTGYWGLYSNVKRLVPTLEGSQAIDATVLNVDNGGGVSPGMILKIESEAEMVESLNNTPTTAITTITEAIADEFTQNITFANGALMHVGEVIRIGLERMKIFELNGNLGGVIRGWDKTPKSSHADNANVDVFRSFNVARNVNGTTAAIHADNSVIDRQMPPEDLKQLARKMASRHLKDSQSGYSGVIGDSTSGQAQYLWITPKELADVKLNYKAW